MIFVLSFTISKMGPDGAGRKGDYYLIIQYIIPSQSKSIH